MSKILTSVLFVLLVCGTAFGVGPLLNHVDALAGWTGSTAFDDSAGLAGVVEWAVFGPGDFPYSDTNLPAPAANEFVYAYQVMPDDVESANLFFVNMQDSNEAGGIGYFDLTPGIAPTNSWFTNAPPNLFQANWDLNVPSGSASDGLAYSSVNAPVVWFGGAANGGASHTVVPLPAPGDLIPEPVTMTLLLAGAGAFVALRRKHSGV